MMTLSHLLVETPQRAGLTDKSEDGIARTRRRVQKETLKPRTKKWPR